MTSDKDDNDECDTLLGINSFFSELSKISSTSKRKREDDDTEGNKSTVLPSFSETFGRKRTKNVEGSRGSNMASCRVGLL
ncbi:hypothetical protein, partial [Salmonella sp. s51933]|uniref:hypothetical protein n=1 Tax=Salmonella sp. s51933 TaxID=3160127 RepID=UPI003753F76C